MVCSKNASEASPQPLLRAEKDETRPAPGRIYRRRNPPRLRRRSHLMTKRRDRGAQPPLAKIEHVREVPAATAPPGSRGEATLREVTGRGAWQVAYPRLSP